MFGAHGGSITVRAEQAVYGSFPFWDRGYALLAQSDGCSKESLDAFRSACGRYGERPFGVAAREALFALPMAGEAWMIVGVGASESDDRGRPGALSFHALFVTEQDYRRAGAAPFSFEPHLRRAWGPRGETLPNLTLPVTKFQSTQDGPLRACSTDVALAVAIAGVLRNRRKVALEEAGPIDSLARAVWSALPARVRARKSIATWAHGNDNRFDLVALPRLTESAVDRAYVEMADVLRPEGWPTPAERARHVLARLGRGATEALRRSGRMRR